MSKRVNLSIRVEQERKDAYEQAAAALGHDSLSEVVREILDAVLLRVSSEGWRSGVVVVADGFDTDDAGCDFQIVGPEPFWRKLSEAGSGGLEIFGEYPR